MQTIEYTFGGKTLHLYFNGNAMFAIDALNAGIGENAPDTLELAHSDTADGHDALCRVAAILAKEGEHCRRYLQYSPERIPTEQELRLLLTPVQMVGLRAAVYRAVSAGFGSGPDSDGGDIDTGLAELEKNKTLTMPLYLHLASASGIPPRDALLLLTPGQVVEISTIKSGRREG